MERVNVMNGPVTNDEANQRNCRTLTLRIKHDYVILCATFLIVTLGFFFSEKIPVGNGFGWDGQVYGELARNWSGTLHDNPLNQYTVRRILPSALVHVGMKLVRCRKSDKNVIRGFGLLNIICVTSVAWSWVATANSMRIGSRGKWLGFFALIVNFAVIKHTSYYPVLTDIPAYAIGCGMLACYLHRKNFWLCSLTALGAFVWPMLLLQGIILFLFPRETEIAPGSFQDKGKHSILSTSNPSPSSFFLAAFAAYCFVLVVHWSVTHANLPICGFISPVMFLYPLSLALSAIYVFFVVLRLIDAQLIVGAIRELFTRNGRHLIAAVVFVVVIQLAYVSLGPLAGPSNGRIYILRLAIKSVAKPFIFLLGHAVYYGPIVPMAVLLWPQISRAIRRVGTGLSIATVMALIHAIDGESRHLIHAFPLIVPFAIQAMMNLNWGRKNDLIFAALCVFASKIWFTINSPQMDASGSLLEYPLQGYAMNYGVFMNNESYLIQGAMAAAVTGFLYKTTLHRFAI